VFATSFAAPGPPSTFRGKNISDGLRLLGWIKGWRAWAMERETIEMAAWVICRTSKQAATRPSVHGKRKIRYTIEVPKDLRLEESIVYLHQEQEYARICHHA